MGECERVVCASAEVPHALRHVSLAACARRRVGRSDGGLRDSADGPQEVPTCCWALAGTAYPLGYCTAHPPLSRVALAYLHQDSLNARRAAHSSLMGTLPRVRSSSEPRNARVQVREAEHACASTSHAGCLQARSSTRARRQLHAIPGSSLLTEVQRRKGVCTCTPDICPSAAAARFKRPQHLQRGAC